VDANGNDASSPDFDAENIVQWGFVNQYAGPMRQNATLFGGGSLYEDNGDGTYTAVFPDHWRTAFDWMYNGMRVDHFIPTGAQEQSDQLAAGNPFASGNVAMANSHLWYTCCLPDDTDWNAAALPSYEGTVTARLHGDTFRILKESDNPEAAFEVMQYLTGEAALDLLQIYGGMPARPEEREGYFAALDETFTQGVNWEVAADGLNYVEVPQHEEWLPNFLKANDRINAFWTLLQNEPDLDVNGEIDTLVGELQAIYDEPAE
jgi:multiple sugar transport system substrate-binding protein